MKPIYILIFLPPKIVFLEDEYFSVETVTILPEAPNADFRLMVGEAAWHFSVVCGCEVRNEKIK